MKNVDDDSGKRIKIRKIIQEKTSQRRQRKGINNSEEGTKGMQVNRNIYKFIV
jgi:hypothetical protein